MPEIIMADNHEQVYPVWVERGHRNVKLTHLDFHCDMRGILIDRPAGKAFFTSHRESTFVDRGNFLAHAIMNGIVTDLTWVHGPNGGRAHDHGPVVAYESDWLAPLHRHNHKRSGMAEADIRFRECLMEDWQGLEPAEQLDLDWDAFASVEHEPGHREELVEAFMARDFNVIPELTFLIYSPGYSDPDRTLYEAFAERLADRFSAQVTRLPNAELNREGEKKGALRSLVKKVAPPQLRDAKRYASKAWRHFESAHDLDAPSNRAA